MKKIDWILIKIQWLIILIVGIFLLFHGHNHDFVIVLWVLSVVCNAFWSRGYRVANVEYAYSQIIQRYPIVWMVLRMLIIVIISIFVIGYVI